MLALDNLADVVIRESRTSFKVQLTQQAVDSGIKLRGGFTTGRLVGVRNAGGLNVFSVVVIPDGQKTARTYHCDFWSLVD